MNACLSNIEQPMLPGRGRKILLVDDDVVHLKLVTAQLQAAGFVVEGALGAAAAHDALRRSRPLPAAIVSDVVMEETDGFTLCRALRDDPRFALVPIVLLSSAFDEKEDLLLARSVGANALVTRSSTQQACIDAIVESLADGPRANRADVRKHELYAKRMAHQLVRLSERRTSAEARYMAIFEHANDAIGLLTLDGRVLDLNRRWEEITGVSRDELRGRPIEYFDAPGHERMNAEQWAAVAGASDGRRTPVAIGHCNGSTIFLEFTTTTIDLDGIPCVLCIGRDVTSLLQMARRLEASERHYRSLVENVPEVIWSATRDWEFTYFSPNVFKLTGFTAEEMLAAAHVDTFGRMHPDDVEVVRAARDALARNGSPMDVQYRWERRDGEWRWIHLRGVVAGSGIDGILSDVTARKDLETQLFQSQKLEAMGRLTASVAHDFNNILAVVSMNGALLVESLEAGTDDRQIAEDITDAARRGCELTKQLLSFGRDEPAAPQDLDLDTLLAGTERMLARAVGDRAVVELTRRADIGRVHADSNHVVQVVMNLVLNARDAMPKGGYVRLDTSNVDIAENDPRRPSARPAGAYVRLSVSDTGTGMDAATQKRIFDPFFTTKPKGIGTGLGLSTCYGIVAQIGGFIAVDSELGRGTTFHVYLPRSVAA